MAYIFYSALLAAGPSLSNVEYLLTDLLVKHPAFPTEEVLTATSLVLVSLLKHLSYV